MLRILTSVIFVLSTICQAAELEYATGKTITSKALSSEREYYVRLPDSYANSPNRRYPVLYILHGQWDTLPAAATLSLLEGTTPEFILVGVQSQGPELRPAPKDSSKRATPFSQFLHQELVPHIDKNYRTAPYRILSGHSNSGRFVVNSWLDAGNTFSAYYAYSPSLEDGAINTRVDKLGLKRLKQHSPLTVTIASEGDHMQQPFTRLTEQLPPESTGNTHFRRFPEQSHSTSRHASLMYALQTTFAGWVPSRDLKIGGFEGLQKHYSDLEARFGFEAAIPLEMLQRLSAHYSISEEPNAEENTRKIIQHGINRGPENADAFIEIADYLKNNDYSEAGVEVQNAVCAFAPNHRACQLANRSSN